MLFTRKPFVLRFVAVWMAGPPSAALVGWNRLSLWAQSAPQIQDTWQVHQYEQPAAQIGGNWGLAGYRVKIYSEEFWGCSQLLLQLL